jgi:glutathione S-transferase
MSLKLNILPPSVNNMSVRVFVLAAGLPFEEENVWGKTQSDEYISKCPAGLTRSVETEGLPKGLLWKSCAVMMYLANREGLVDLYLTDSARRAMVDSANFHTMSMLYPLVARAIYPRLSFSGYPGEVATSDASDDEREAARKSAEAALSRILEVYPEFFFTDAPASSAAIAATIPDIRLASTLEFLAVTDTELPSWATEYGQRVESALGDAYSEPAADVAYRGANANATSSM